MPRAKAKAKDTPINQIIIKEEKIPDPTPPPSPPTPPVLERQPKKRKPANYKLKMTILQTHVLLSSVSIDETCKISENRPEMAREDTQR